ncbi:sugar transferase [Halalkalicoccus subterraneus]|uniref:sugar transferase n=1 Tax=Halalkalicoccus subterraneus TaxID=2675002 RepID=UPI000EFC2FCC|nr:sugar transferase [Halalkalicoccus subterraneus]
MRPEQLYRLLGVVGTAAATTLAVLSGNSIRIQAVLAALPVVGRTPSVSLAPSSLALVLAVTIVITTIAMQPLYKPRSRRILDTIAATLRSVSLAVLLLATLGYLGFPYRLPRTTLLFVTVLLGFGLSTWFVALQHRYLDGNGRTLIIGTDPERIEAASHRTTDPVVGYASPIHASSATGERVNTDGGYGAVGSNGREYEYLVGLSRLEEILEESNIGTVIPILAQADRAEFFGVLKTCHQYGVNVAVPDGYGDSVLLSEDRDVSTQRTPGFASIDLQPWDLQDRLCKRVFDVLFAAITLLVILPSVCLIAIAIKLDSPGPVLYRQERTALFGGTFHVYKFRSMLPESEATTPGADADRITRVGRFLRRSHLDEIPQLWSILRGDMSVVGPRAAWTAEEAHLLEETRTWRKRWFVKPGLTGLAQINDASSETPEEKVRWDLTYIRKQSFRFDLKIIVRQLWRILTDVASIITSGTRR